MTTLLAKRVQAAMSNPGSVGRSESSQSRPFKDGSYLPLEFGSKGDEFDVVPGTEKGVSDVREGRTTQPG